MRLLVRAVLYCLVGTVFTPSFLVPTVAQDLADTVWVTGAVNKPGFQRVSAGTTLADVLTLAGGKTSAAADELIVVSGSPRVTQADLEQLVRSGLVANNPSVRVTKVNPARFAQDRRLVVRPGQIVFVPSKDAS
jgi:protein involved in polysaccharide export with SLBB domain